MKIIYSPRFESEAIWVYEFIAKDKRKTAKKFLEKVKANIKTLIDNPQKGRPTDDEERELIYKGYPIPYIIDGESIVVMGIFNQNQWSKEED